MDENYMIGKRILETLTTSLYEEPIVVFREYVQNSLDSKIEAEKLGKDTSGFRVNITIDKENATITIEDNGMGIPTSNFKDKMLRLSHSDKKDRPGHIGFRGIGRLSALPLCKKLAFESKYAEEDVINVCIFDAEKYAVELDKKEDNGVLRLIEDITSFSSRQPCDDEGDQFFRVTIENYSTEIHQLLASNSFEKDLKSLLPLRYSEEFSESKLILDKYREYMEHSLETYMCPVYLDGTLLEKPYTNKDIGVSGIIFWNVSMKQNDSSKKLGLMWFTFDTKIDANNVWKKRNIHGILLRSKNMLMGSNSMFADQASKLPIKTRTYKEMIAALYGVSGEMLIYSEDLEDNAKRDWFRMSLESAYLMNYMNTFLETLQQYRYAISKYLNIKEGATKEKAYANVKDRLKDLLEADPEETLSDVVEKYNRIEMERLAKPTEKKKKKDKDESDETNIDFLSVDDERPDYYKDLESKFEEHKQFYVQIMTVMERFMKEEGLFTTFERMRSNLKSELAKSAKDEDTVG